MPNLLLVLTGQHDAETVVALLPKGSVYGGVSLPTAELEALAPHLVWQRVIGPMYAEAKRRWPEVQST